MSHLSMLRAQRLSTVMPTEAFWMKGTSLQTCTPKGQSLARSWGGSTGYQAALEMCFQFLFCGPTHGAWGTHRGQGDLSELPITGNVPWALSHGLLALGKHFVFPDWTQR